MQTGELSVRNRFDLRLAALFTSFLVGCAPSGESRGTNKNATGDSDANVEGAQDPDGGQPGPQSDTRLSGALDHAGMVQRADAAGDGPIDKQAAATDTGYDSASGGTQETGTSTRDTGEGTQPKDAGTQATLDGPPQPPFGSEPCPNGQPLAFPGAEGFGRCTKGGRGGRVIEVTNLNDSGAGSLRACAAAMGPRICAFKVGGTITLASAIAIWHPYLTIDGQRAPGDGIQLKNFGIYINNGEVILRHLRIRITDTNNDWALGVWHTGNGPDGTVVTEVRNVIVDHVSLAWAEDENMSVWGKVRDVTVQWTLSAEGTSGILMGNGSTRVSAHHNLWAHIYRRTPLPNLDTDVVNNVTYDYGYRSTYIVPVHYPIVANVINNYHKEGPSTLKPVDGTDASDAEIWVKCYDGHYPNGIDANSCLDSRVFFSGNMVRTLGGNIDMPARIVRETDSKTGRKLVLPEIGARHSFPMIRTTSAQQAYIDVLAHAGATLPKRDSFDSKIVSEVSTGTGSRPWPFIRKWPTLAGGTPSADPDRDGMPSSWETQYGLDPNNDDSAMDKDGDGYTNVEEYLNGTDPSMK